MKKLVSFALALMLLLSAAPSAFAANAPTYLVASISQRGYLWDEDLRAVDLNHPVNEVAYGKTVYYPLLNDVSVNAVAGLAAAQSAYDAKATARTKQSAYTAAVSTHTAAQSAYINAAAPYRASGVADVAGANAVLSSLTNLVSNYAISGDTWIVAMGNNSLIGIADLSAAQTLKTSLTISQTSYTTAQTGLANAQAEYLSAAGVSTVSAANALLLQLQTELAAAQATVTGSTYPYVYESSAGSSIRTKSRWELGSTFVASVSVERCRFYSAAYPANAGSRSYIYFVAVKIKERATTALNDLVGYVQISKSGTYGFDFTDAGMQLDVQLSLNYSSENSTTIGTALRLFEEGVAFDDDEETYFYFDAFDSSYFVVNTVGQRDILLSVDNDYDSSIGNRYPQANIEFFNGNGATFNKLGYLYLEADPGTYLYSIDDDGELSAVTASYDSYEGCFVVRTRKLGRYAVSETKLRLTSTGSAAGSTGTGSGTTVVIPIGGTTSTVNPTTGGVAPGASYQAPPAASKPAASVSVPAAAAPAPSVSVPVVSVPTVSLAPSTQAPAASVAPSASAPATPPVSAPASAPAAPEKVAPAAESPVRDVLSVESLFTGDNAVYFGFIGGGSVVLILAIAAIWVSLRSNSRHIL